MTAFDERAHAGAEHLDAAFVAAYDEKQGVGPDAFAEAAALVPEGGVVVDFGAGTGAFAAAAAARAERVVAVDPSPAMLAAVAARGLPNVECVEGGFLSYTHAGASADVVHSRNALHHLPDFWKALALVRVAGLLRRGGTFLLTDLVYSFEPHEADDALEAWYTAADARGGGYGRADLEAHVRDEHSTFSWLLEPMLDRAGFEIRHADYSGLRTFASYTCVRR